MRVLNLSLGQDTGGQALRTAEAFARHAPEWTYDARARTPTFYPLPARFIPMEIKRELWPAADVVHVHNGLGAVRRYGRRDRKPAVVHYHGTAYRTGPARRLAEQRAYGAVGIVSTLDLWAIAPDETEWLPAPYNLEAMAAFRAPEDDGTVRIAHAPTSRIVKGTAALLAVVERLRREGRRVELDVIEGRPWNECLRRKGRADIYVDQMLLGYGCNAVEAWAMGIPVVAGVDRERAWRAIHQSIPEGTRAAMVDTFGELPFLEATEATLYAALSDLMDPAVRAEYGERGRLHAERFHAGALVVPRLMNLYRRALSYGV